MPLSLSPWAAALAMLALTVASSSLSPSPSEPPSPLSSPSLVEIWKCLGPESFGFPPAPGGFLGRLSTVTSRGKEVISAFRSVFQGILLAWIQGQILDFSSLGPLESIPRANFR